MKKIMELQTVQVSAIKNLFESLKEILAETNMEISKKGIKINAMDPSLVIFSHLFLDANKFEKYVCNETIMVGINMINFFKLIKTVVNNDTLTIYIDSDNRDKINIEILSAEYNSTTRYVLNTIDIDEGCVSANPSDYNLVITMPSHQFQKVCREANNISDKIEIKSIGKQLIFSCDGDFASQETIYAQKNNDDGLIFECTDDSIDTTVVQGYFLLKYLILFSKCTSLCPNIKLYLGNAKPLVIEFSVGTIGTLTLVIAPHTDSM